MMYYSHKQTQSRVELVEQHQWCHYSMKIVPMPPDPPAQITLMKTPQLILLQLNVKFSFGLIVKSNTEYINNEKLER